MVEKADVFVTPLEVQRALETLPDEDLIELGSSLQEDAWRKWLTQCCIAHILLSRKEGWLKELARRWDITPTRVSEMASIWRKIVEPLSASGEALPPLPPSFFHEALRSNDPLGTIRVAADAKARDPKFSTRQLRRMIAAEKNTDDVVTCKNCQFFQWLPGLPVTLEIRGTRYELTVDLGACRHKGILVLKLDSDLEFLAESCEEFWSRV